ncbi:MAG: hypothetical protein V4471_00820 [Pseudomonadota bacterium]
MNRRLETLRREKGGLNRELDSCDSVVRDFTRILGTKKAVVTKFESQPIENREKLDSAKRKRETAQQDYNRASENYYRIFAALRQNNIELEKEERINMDLQRTFRR